MRSHFVFLMLLIASPATAHTPWQSQTLLASPDPPLAARVIPVFERLVSHQPIGLLDLPGRDLRLLLETGGKLKVIDATDMDPEVASTILDLSMYGEEIAAVRDMTLDPAFERNGYVYLVWGIKPMLKEGGTRVSRFTLPISNPPMIDLESRLDLFSYPSGDHVGASLRFGPDGYLYIGTGDGSGPNPPDLYRTAQNLSDVRGSILRIDVRDATAEKPYRIPHDNPFVGSAEARPEIFSFGVRNAFRIEFDPKQGNLWVADVGWVRSEMLHHTFAGANHGWSLYEGPHAVEPEQARGPGEIVTPALALPRAESQSITGGVFQSEQSTFFPGQYLFGDYMNGAVWAADLSDPRAVRYEKIADTNGKVVSFTQLSLGTESELASIVIDHRGRFLRLIHAEKDSAVEEQEPFPFLLSDTGLFASTSTLELADGVVRYQPAATMWRDGASSDRLVAIPSTDPIQANRNRRQFSYPAGTVFANTISQKVLDENNVDSIVRLETQVLVFDGFNWHPYTYRWNQAQTNATLVPKFGDEMPIRLSDPIHQSRDSIYRFQARDQCKTCHHAFHPGAMSFTPTNLTGKSGSTAWSQFASEGWVSREPGSKTLQVDPYDESEPLDQRARSYLDMNCATCHAPAGAGLSKLNVLYETPLASTAALGEAPLQGSFGLDSPSVLVAGHPERSVMMYRIATSGAGRMPHIGSDLPDPRGAKLIWDWIASMPDDSLPNVAGEATSASATSATLELWYQLQTPDVEVAKATVAKYLETPHTPFDAGLLDAWVAPSQRKQTIGNRPDVAEIIKLSGDANRGASWYADVSGSQCRACHQKNGVGVAIGPSLDGLRKNRSKGEVIRSLLFPSETVEAKYRAFTFLLSEGTVVTGLVLGQNAEVTTVRKTDGSILELPNESIEQSHENSQSIMPDRQLASLTAQEVADLVAYLMR